MFPIPWNFPLRKKNGNLVNIGDAIDEGTEIPEHGEGDAGKVLSVDENGDLEWSDDVNSEIQTLGTKLDDEVETRAKLGAHNLSLPIIAPASAVFDVSVTVNSDGVVTLDGTATSSGGRASLKSNAFILKAGTYKLSKNASDTSIAIRVCIQDEPNRTARIAETDSDKNDVEFTLDNDTLISTAINLDSGSAYADGFNIKPMITLISDASNEYLPYAMTNRELTEKVDGVDYEMQYNGAYFHVIKYGDYYHCYSNSNFSSTPSIDDWTTIGSVPNSKNRDFCGILLMNSGVILKVRVKADGNVQIYKVSGTFGSNLYIQCSCVLA